MGEALILAIDQGTTGTTAVLSTPRGEPLARGSREFAQHFPAPGWVEHDPEEIWESVLGAVNHALDQVPQSRSKLAAIGITNQRETIVVWDEASGAPVHRALVWQDRRTAARCEELNEAGHGARVRQVTGLVIDPYFSASKLEWLLAEEAGLRRRAERGEVKFGTIEGFLVRRLTGERRAIMEITNASRTLLLDLEKRRFDEGMCALWGVPEAILPELVPSAGRVGTTRGVPGLPDGIPITGIAGDQHAALFGQGCVHPGEAKCTYGTGAFVLVNTGSVPLQSSSGLLTTLAWQIGDEVVYALEGSCFIAGAAVQWLRDGLGIIESSSEIEALARQVDSADGVVFVPALSGLGAPHWDPLARGLVTGITRGTTKAHLARATLEAIALQVEDLLEAMDADLRAAARGSLSQLRVDGGASADDLLLELQADFSGIAVERPTDVESTARGAVLLAALGVGLLRDVSEVASALRVERRFEPRLDAEARAARKAEWRRAVGRALSSPAERSGARSPADRE